MGWQGDIKGLFEPKRTPPLSIDNFIYAYLKNFAELAKHFYVRLRAPLLPIGVTTFNNSQPLRNLLLRQFAIPSYHLQILTKQ